MTSVGAPPLWKRRTFGGARSGMHGLGFSRRCSHLHEPSMPRRLERAIPNFEISGLTASRGNNVADTFSVLVNGTGPYPLWQRSLDKGTVGRPWFHLAQHFHLLQRLRSSPILRYSGGGFPQHYDVWHRLHSRRICGWLLTNSLRDTFLLLCICMRLVYISIGGVLYDEGYICSNNI